MQNGSLPPVNFILQRHGNHAAVSGYDRISDYIPSRVFQRVIYPNAFQRVISWLLKSWYLNSGSQWYSRAGLTTELMIVPQWLRRSGQIFHFAYGENSYRYIWKLKRWRKNYIVCTYHTPPGRFVEVVMDRAHLQEVDAVILVSRVSYDLFAELLGGHRVHFIPHGIDTEFFKPPETPRAHGRELQCLFVGSHLRDFQLLADAARKFEKTRPDIRFEVVILKRDYHYFDGLTNVTLRTRLSDEELRAAYQRANVFLMPLVDATANNSLLEAMACGLPMVVSDLPGVRDYIDEAGARLAPVGDRDAFIGAIASLIDDPVACDNLGKVARERSLQFSLPTVARLTKDLYLRLVEADKTRGRS